MPLPVIHDPADAACRCHGCCQERVRDVAEELAMAERIASCEREQASALRDAQLRLPVFPLPHCAGQTSTLLPGERQTEFAL